MGFVRGSNKLNQLGRKLYRIIDAKNCHVAAAHFDGLPEQKIEEKPKAEASRDWLVITIPEGKENLQDEIIETLTFYEGDINVGLKVGGKKLHLKNIKVRRCNALESELQTFLDEEDYVFFRA